MTSVPPYTRSTTSDRSRSSVPAALLALISILTTLVLILGSQPAEAATTHLNLSGPSTTSIGKSATLTIGWKVGSVGHRGSVTLQRKAASTWAKVLTATTSTSGTVKVSVKPLVTTTYRVKASTGQTSAAIELTIKPPTSFTISGSGNGHGVGMSQYGAYQLALEGKNAQHILTTYYPGTKLGVSTNPARRIGVQVFGPGSDSAATTTISIKPTTTGAKPGWRLVDASAAKPVIRRSDIGAIVMKVAVASGKPTVTIGTKTYTGAKLEVQWSGTSVAGAPSGAASYASVSGAQGTYRNGQLALTAISGRSQPNVVNDVLLNTEYLYGIDEMPSSWGLSGSGKGLQALEAQAIAARGYAVQTVYNRAANPACNCNLYDDTRSQNYTGWAKQHGTDGSIWKKAVDATTTRATATTSGTDQILTYGGATAFVDTPYFAATGAAGRTAANQDVFGSAKLGYLQGVADPYTAEAPGLPSGDKTWARSVSQATMVRIFGLSTVKSVAITAKYGSGQVKTLKATSDTGSTKSITRTSDGWRSALGLQAAWLSKLTPIA